MMIEGNKLSTLSRRRIIIPVLVLRFGVDTAEVVE